MSTSHSESNPRRRAVAIVLHNHDILVIYRENYGQIYFTFPGGGIEGDESLPQACTRELYEEASVTGLVLKHIGNSTEPSQNKQRLGEIMANEIFQVEYVSGTPAIHPNSPEAKKVALGAAGGNQIYRPQWIPFERFLGKEDVFFPTQTAQIVRDWVASQISR